MAKTPQFRQGDVLLTLSKVPAKDYKMPAVPATSGFVILAARKGGSHSHFIPASRATLFGDDLFCVLEVLKPTWIFHSEYRSIALEPGCYRVKYQREYSNGSED